MTSKFLKNRYETDGSPIWRDYDAACEKILAKDVVIWVLIGDYFMSLVFFSYSVPSFLPYNSSS